MHLLDDAQYAAMCVRHYAAKGYGAGRIRNELYRRGIPRELWDDALQELPEQDDQIDTLLRRRLRSDTPDRDELRRASDYLYRRGFGRDEIRAAIARYQDNFEEVSTHAISNLPDLARLCEESGQQRADALSAQSGRP